MASDGQSSSEQAAGTAPGRQPRTSGLSSVQRKPAKSAGAGAPASRFAPGELEDGFAAAVLPVPSEGRPEAAAVQRKAKSEPSTAGSDGAGKPQEVQEGEAFIKGTGDKLDIDPNDVEQNQLGDCWLLAGLMAIARANPELIRNMVKPAGEGKWQVTFNFPAKGGGFTAESVIVDAKVPVSKKGGRPMFAQIGDTKDGKKELWALLVEKAYAKTQGSYANVSGSKSPDDHFAMEIISGKKDTTMSPSSTSADTILDTVEKALAEKKGATFWTIKKGHSKAPLAAKHKPKIITNHGYSLSGVDKKARTVDLMNPWGRAWDLTGLDIDKVKKFFRNIRIGG